MRSDTVNTINILSLLDSVRPLNTPRKSEYAFFVSDMVKSIILREEEDKDTLPKQFRATHKAVELLLHFINNLDVCRNLHI